MYYDSTKFYWWNGIKKRIANLVSKIPNCQQVYVEDQRPGGFSEKIDLNIDFITCLPSSRKQHDSIWGLSTEWHNQPIF